MRTLKALRNGERPLLMPDCVEALLHWLCGGRKGPAQPARRILGDPAADDGLVERVYQALEETLFSGDALRPVRGSRETRQQRYRLLVRAFHPDRFPHLESWLISRSQTINAAYVAFRDNPDAEAQPEPAADRDARPAERPARPPARRPLRRAVNRIGLRDRWIHLTAPLARIRYLPQKIMAGVVMICLVPLVVLYHINHRDDAASAETIVEALLPDALVPAAEDSALADSDSDTAVPAETVAMQPAASSTPEPAASSTQVAEAEPRQIDAAPGERAGDAIEDEPVAIVEATVILPQPAEDIAPAEITHAVLYDVVVPAPPPVIEVAEAASVTADMVAVPVSESETEAGFEEPAVTAEDAVMADRSPEARSAEAEPAPPVAAATPAPEPAPETRPAAAREPDPVERAAGEPSAAAPEPAADPPAMPARVVRHEPPPPPDRTTAAARAQPDATPVTDDAAPGTAAHGRSEEVAAVDAALAIMEQYRSSFEGGQLEVLLATLANRPRENQHTGMNWFRQTYGDLFGRTASRQLQIEFRDKQHEGWHVGLSAHYELTLVYRNGSEAHASGDIYYELVPQAGEWRIQNIEYERAR